MNVNNEHDKGKGNSMTKQDDDKLTLEKARLHELANKELTV